MNNPYEVLGIPANASDEEVKRAYREQSRKYHPDSYANNPLADLAEEKFKEVQEAYDEIMRQREGRGSAGGYSGQGSYSGNYGGTGSEDGLALQAAFNYVNNRRYQEALRALAGVRSRNADWYYCSALSNAGLGNNAAALEQARQAVNMEPYNKQYQDLLNRLEWNGRRYQTSNYGYGRPVGQGQQTCSTGNCCCDMWIADSLCECMGGDICSCM